MISDNELRIPSKLLDLCAIQHKIIAHNLANAEHFYAQETESNTPTGGRK